LDDILEIDAEKFKDQLSDISAKANKQWKIQCDIKNMEKALQEREMTIEK